MTTPVQVPETADLRPALQTKNITLTPAANHLGAWPAVISNIERGLGRDDAFANAYRQWLTAA
ncbi:XRE family transcriptional regulator [Streptomyces sp. NPDC055085]